jgi:hypothetical protein
MEYIPRIIDELIFRLDIERQDASRFTLGRRERIRWQSRIVMSQFEHGLTLGLLDKFSKYIRSCVHLPPSPAAHQHSYPAGAPSSTTFV